MTKPVTGPIKLDMAFFSCVPVPEPVLPPHVEDAELEAAFDEVRPEKHKGKKHRKAQMPLDHS